MRKLPTKVNTKSNITIWRNEKKKSLKVVIAEMEEEKKQIEKPKMKLLLTSLKAIMLNNLDLL